MIISAGGHHNFNVFKIRTRLGFTWREKVQRIGQWKSVPSLTIDDRKAAKSLIVLSHYLSGMPQ